MKNKKSYDPDEYTYEDYLKDFELDYLGFDGVPEKPVSGQSSEKLSGDEPEQETDDQEEKTKSPHPGLQNRESLLLNSCLAK